MLYPFIAIRDTALVRLDSIIAITTVPGGSRVYTSDGGSYPTPETSDTILKRMSDAAARMHT